MGWLKQIFGVCLAGIQPRCNTCGKTMEVKSLNDNRGVHFRCVDSENEFHKAQDVIHNRWLEKVAALEKEFEAEDAMMYPNYARQQYGKIKVEVRRKQE